MTKTELTKRYTLFLISLFFCALGVSITARAQLGTSPISSFPYVLSMIAPALTLGMFTFFLNLLFITLQIIILRKDFCPIQLLQIPLSVCFGAFVDLTGQWLASIPLDNYAMQMLFSLLGCLVLAFGVTLSVIANVIMNSGEAFVKAIADKTHKDFGTIKIANDVGLVCISVIISFAAFHTLVGIREGTAIAALLIGILVKLLKPRLSFINEFLISPEKEKISSVTGDEPIS